MQSKFVDKICSSTSRLEQFFDVKWGGGRNNETFVILVSGSSAGTLWHASATRSTRYRQRDGRGRAATGELKGAWEWKKEAAGYNSGVAKYCDEMKLLRG